MQTIGLATSLCLWLPCFTAATGWLAYSASWFVFVWFLTYRDGQMLIIIGSVSYSPHPSVSRLSATLCTWPGQLVAMATERRDPAAVRLIRPVAGARHVTSARTHARTHTRLSTVSSSCEDSDDFSACSHHINWTDLNKSTQLHDAFIGHSRQHVTTILCIDWLQRNEAGAHSVSSQHVRFNVIIHNEVRELQLALEFAN